MNKQTALIIFLAFVVIVLLGVFIYKIYPVPQILNKVYVNGYNAGALNLVYQINKNGEVPVLISNNQTGNTTIQMISIQKICGGGK